VETDLLEFPLDILVAGKRSRFNRIGFVSFVGIACFDDVNKRFIIAGAEHGNDISMIVFAIDKKMIFVRLFF
jgi:hypothetical protein